MDKSKESPGKLVVTGSDATKELKFLEEAFHKMAFFVLPPVAMPWFYGAYLGRDAVSGMLLLQKTSNRFCTISFVRHDS